MSILSHGWLIRPLGVSPFAVSERQVVSYQPKTLLVSVPFTVPHCNSMCHWKENWVPILNLSGTTGTVEKIEGSVVLAYQAASDQAIEFIGIAVSNPPTRVTIDDNNFVSSLDRSDTFWYELAKSAYADETEGTVPIIDVGQLNGDSFRENVLGCLVAKHATSTLDADICLHF